MKISVAVYYTDDQEDMVRSDATAYKNACEIDGVASSGADLPSKQRQPLIAGLASAQSYDAMPATTTTLVDSSAGMSDGESNRETAGASNGESPPLIGTIPVSSVLLGQGFTPLLVEAVYVDDACPPLSQSEWAAMTKTAQGSNSPVVVCQAKDGTVRVIEMNKTFFHLPLSNHR